MPTTTNYFWDEANLLAEADGANTINAVYTNEPQRYGNLVSSRISNATSYHHFDGTGSTRQLTNSTGAVTDQITYDAWGKTLSRTGVTSTFNLWAGEFGYYFDVETSTFWIQVRPYQAAIGRWTSQDLLGLITGLNL